MTDLSCLGHLAGLLHSIPRRSQAPAPGLFAYAFICTCYGNALLHFPSRSRKLESEHAGENPARRTRTSARLTGPGRMSLSNKGR